MDRCRDVVVMLCGPNYGKRDRGRVRAAIILTRAVRGSLVVCGDSNGGADVRAFVRVCRLAGVERVLALPHVMSNTRQDAQNAAWMIGKRFPSARRVWVVTHWYHMPRAWIAMRQEFEAQRLSVRLLLRPVLSDLRDGLRRLPGEVRGCVDYLQRRAQRRFGRPLGKPDEERQQDMSSPRRRWNDLMHAR